MKRAAVVLAVAVVVAGSLLVAPGTAGAVVPASYTITDIGPVGSSYSIGYGISDDGEVVMHASVPGGGYTGYRWDGGTLSDLDDLPTGYQPDSLPRAVNTAGRAVGQSAGLAVVWTGTAVAAITTAYGQAWDVNESGTVVGDSQDTGTGSGNTGPFRWDGTLHPLALPDGAERGQALAVNDSGVVVGTVEDIGTTPPDDFSGVLPAMWASDGTLTVLDTPIPVDSSFYARDVNATGEILVASGQQAFVGHQGAWQALGTLAPGGFLEAMRMNDAGQVVGRADRTDGGAQTAVLYDPDVGHLVDLQSLLPSGSGWTLQEAFDINDSGQIVGYGVRSGQLRAFLMTPSAAPAPHDVEVVVLTGAGTVGTNGSVSAGDPVGTSVTTTRAGSVSILEGGNASYGSPASYETVGGVVAVSAPSGTAADPLRLTFTYFAGLLPAGFDPASATLTRNGELLGDCDPDGTLPDSGDPCVLERAFDGAGNFVVTALTVDASEWSLVRKATWPFGGFKAPVDGGSVVNTAKAGSAIPVKFSVGGYRGLDIFASGYPRTTKVDCLSGAPTDAIETTVTAGASSLAYDARTDTYTYVWKTAKTAKGCFVLDLGLADGSQHTARFKLS